MNFAKFWRGLRVYLQNMKDIESLKFYKFWHAIEIRLQVENIFQILPQFLARVLEIWIYNKLFRVTFEQIIE